MNKKQKKQPVKRKYTKRATKNSIKNLELVEPEHKDKETAELAQIIHIFEGWAMEQKQRNLKYLCSRFYDFL